MTVPDPLFDRIVDAVDRFRAGDVGARDDLCEVWRTIGPVGDAFHRCTLAHYLADMYDDPARALIWDVRALDAADALSDGRVREQHSTLELAGFYPSLHLNLADDLRRLGSFDTAAEHIGKARESLHVLADDAYGAIVRTAVDEVAEAIENGSTVRRDTHP